MKAKHNSRFIMITILVIMMFAFACLAVACNNDNKPSDSSSLGGSSSMKDSSSEQGGDSSSNEDSSSAQGGTSSSTSSSEGSSTTPNTGIGANDNLTVPEGYKEVKASLNISDYQSKNGDLAEDIVAGVFTIQAGANIRGRQKDWSGAVSYKDYPYLNLHKTLDGATSIPKEDFTYSLKITNKVGLKVNVPGDGYLSLYIQNGSSGVSEQSIYVNGTEYKFCGTTFGSPVVQLGVDVTKGEYTVIRGSGTVDIFMAELHCVAPDSPATGITVSTAPQTEFLAGQQFDSDGLVVGLLHEDKTQEVLTEGQYSVDSSAVQMDTPGTYNVTITYSENTNFTCSYEVHVNELKEIKVGLYATEKVANSAAGNGVYYNQSVKTVYKMGEALDTKYLTVNAYDTNDRLYLFKNDSEYLTYKYNGADFTALAAGNYTITVSLTLNGVEKTASYDVSVIDAELATSTVDGVETAFVYVDGNYSENNGVVSKPANVEQECNNFKTIGMALEFLNGIQLNGKPVILYIASGTYKEKLEIEVPNLTIKGLGTNNSDTIIEWDSLYGVNDASGYNQVTDSTQSVAVREKAENCTMVNLTISNYWNSVARFDERADKDSCDHRALALLVQSDKFIMDNCRLLGYQDTVEFFYGRQLIKNSFISGTTDFIFGTNNTTYFYNCEIKSTAHVKGTPGYITAFKGCSKGESDYVQYGAIFDNCDFTAEDGVANTAIGRTWGAYAAVAVINSRLGGHISTKPSTGASGSERYVAMSGILPTADTVKFVEYGNTGDGAVSATQAGMTYLEETVAAEYSNLSVIFGKVNGKVTYTDVWTPSLD